MSKHSWRLAILLALASHVVLAEGPGNDGQGMPPDPPLPFAATPDLSKPKAVPPVAAPDPAPRTRQPGSLYSDAGFRALTSDRRGHGVGDLVTVLIYENSSASSSADTGASRESNVGVGVSGPIRLRNWEISANNDFGGNGRTQRAGRILAQITVAVHEVQPGGVLVVRGEQLLEINGEKQTIRLEGRIRSRDVSDQNVVLSTRVADARIAFVGDGVVADQQMPRWWQRLLGLFGI